MTDPRLEHLDPATIAALVDQTLDPAARAAAEAHLAACADCREVWVETSEIDSEMRGVTTSEPSRGVVVPSRPGSRRSWIYGAAGLAAAAAIAFAVLSPRMFDGSADLQELVDAVGDNRRTEARLTGGFKWGPVPSVTRGSETTADTRVEAAAAAVLDRVQEDSARALANAGVAELSLGNIDAAIQYLARAAERDGDSAAIWSDLSAAHLERARLLGNATDASAALAAADRALSIDRNLAEAQFNRALALTHLSRMTEARDAWQNYLRMDEGSLWASEARTRLASPSLR